jgi:glycosyltransferase involved in cell wall biosynthesis
VVESLACGTPVVAFNIGGVPEMVKHQQNGFLAAPDKWKNLGEGILYILDNHDELTSNAREFAVNNFSPEIVASRYTEIYHSVLNLVYS